MKPVSALTSGSLGDENTQHYHKICQQIDSLCEKPKINFGFLSFFSYSLHLARWNINEISGVNAKLRLIKNNSHSHDAVVEKVVDSNFGYQFSFLNRFFGIQRLQKSVQSWYLCLGVKKAECWGEGKKLAPDESRKALLDNHITSKYQKEQLARAFYKKQDDFNLVVEEEEYIREFHSRDHVKINNVVKKKDDARNLIEPAREAAQNELHKVAHYLTSTSYYEGYCYEPTSWRKKAVQERTKRRDAECSKLPFLFAGSGKRGLSKII